MWADVDSEQSHLTWIRRNRHPLRAHLHRGGVDALLEGVDAATSVRKKAALPAIKSQRPPNRAENPSRYAHFSVQFLMIRIITISK